MKNLFLILSLCLLSFAASAQRFGAPPKDDNTGRVITYSYKTLAVLDTIAVFPNVSYTFANVAKLTKAVKVKVSTANAKAADHIEFIFLCDTLTAGRIVTFITPTGYTLESAGTVTVAKNKEAVVTFTYDGVNSKWSESSRSVH